jgi:soluble lytic murein transglycosylase-like protein
MILFSAMGLLLKPVPYSATKPSALSGWLVATLPDRFAAALPTWLATILSLCAILAFHPAYANQQLDPQLREVVAAAIAQADCFTDRFDSEVWYKLMEPRLRRQVTDESERLDILKTIYCETHRPDATPLPPGLVLAVIDVESNFDRWAVSSAGAVGLMQVMPYWPERLGLRRDQLVHAAPNIRMGCAILRFYLKAERNDYARALARYNGSINRSSYPAAVMNRWTRWTGADDLGQSVPAQPRAQPQTP